MQIGKDEFMDHVINALEKQIPKKVVVDNVDPNGEFLSLRYCPSCGVRFIQYGMNYCGNCGQKLDWSEEIKAKYKLFLVEEKLRKENGVCEG